jgi:uncharacterized lipoprotein NlpE involved in copper resistance
MKKLVIALAVMVLMIGCDQQAQEQKSGTLTVSLQHNEPFQQRNITPESTTNTTISSYTLEGTGPKGASFSDISSTNSTVQLENLLWGPWTITAVGYTADGMGVSQGTVTTTITSLANEATLILDTPVGNGALDIICTWDETQIGNDASVTAEIYTQGGVKVTEVSALADNGVPVTLSFTDIAAGFYTVMVKLYDEQTLVAGFVDTVRIYDGITCTGEQTLNLDKLSGIDLIIDDQTAMAITGNITMDIPATGDPAVGTSFTLTYTPDNLDPAEIDQVTYQWYADGVAISAETSSSLAISSAAGGTTRYDVVATLENSAVSGNDHYGSAGFLVTVPVEPYIVQ